MKGNKVFLLLLITAISCRNKKVEVLLNKQQIDSFKVVFYEVENTDVSFFIDDKEKINELFDRFLSKSSEAFGKFPIKYSVVLYCNGAISDTLYFSDIDYRSSKTGTRKMKKDIGVFFEKLNN